MLNLRSVLGSLVLLLLFSVSLLAVVPPSRRFGPIIDRYQSYVPQRTCSPTEKPGVVDFRHILLTTYTGSRNLGIIRGCSVGGTSEHKEGRAWDWGVRASVPREAQYARDLLNWLLTRDPHGNANARFRRFGVMYIIWNRQIWAGYRASQGWRSYSGSNPHTDHVHFSFGWPGARRETTWWHPNRTGTPRAGAGPEWDDSVFPEDFEVDGLFPGTTSPIRDKKGVEEAAERLGAELLLLPIRDGDPEDPERYCPQDQLRVAWEMPDIPFRYGGHILPLGPEPDETTTSVNGILYCDGYDYAYVGFEAWWDESLQMWMVLNTPASDD
jgi:hypothetical protein